MRSVFFDYPNTCPKIDNEIGKARDIIISEIESILNVASPLMSDSDIRKHASDFAYDLYQSLESCFETVRSVNEDMRRQADSQIEDLIEEVRNLEYELREARSQIE